MTTVDQAVYRGTVSNQLGLYRYQEGVVRRILEVLEASRLDVLEQVRRSIERRRATTYTGLRLARISQEITGATVEAYRVLGDALEGELSGLAGAAVAGAARVVEDALPFTFHMSRPDAGLLEAIATRSPFEGRVLRDHVSTLESSYRASLLREIRVGMTLGETTDQVARRVRGVPGREGADGLSRRQATVLTRTAVQHVHAEARDQLYFDNQDVVSAVMGVVTLDERTCPICGPRDGKVWRLPNYEPVDHDEEWGAGAGRWHWQCRCTSIPVIDGDWFVEQGGDLSALREGERAAQDGPVSVDTDYDEWLRGQSLAERERVLGKARAAWWDSHPGKSLAEAWGERFGRSPVEEASAEEALDPPRERVRRPLPTYYPSLGEPLHEVYDWSKVRWLIRALRRGDDLPPVYMDGEEGSGVMISGTHRAAASEIRALLDGGYAYEDLRVIDVSEYLTEEILDALDGDPELACELIERALVKDGVISASESQHLRDV